MNRSIRKLKTEYFLDLLKAKEPFTFVRYGDGEVRTILGGVYENTRNSNGCTFSPKLRKALRNTLGNQDYTNYYYGALRVMLRNHRMEFNQFQLLERLNIQWIDGDIFLNDILAGKFFPVIQEFRNRRILMVGQPFLYDLQEKGFFTWKDQIIPIRQNAIEERKRIVELVKDTIVQRDIDLVLWSSGLHTKVFAHDIYQWAQGGVVADALTQIDCGSMWDGFCDQLSRSYIRRGKVDWEALTEVNTGKRKARKGETFRIK